MIKSWSLAPKGLGMGRIAQGGSGTAVPYSTTANLKEAGYKQRSCYLLFHLWSQCGEPLGRKTGPEMAEELGNGCLMPEQLFSEFRRESGPQSLRVTPTTHQLPARDQVTHCRVSPHHVYCLLEREEETGGRGVC